MRRVIILISGKGSNMENLILSNFSGKVVLVVSNNPDALGLKKARDMGIDTKVIDHKKFSRREDFDSALADTIAGYHPDLIALAGFMRILTEKFVMRFENKILNIHPSLLPAFPGENTHKKVLAQGCLIHGCSVHFVTNKLDGGPIIIQAVVPVLPKDNHDSLAKRVLKQEHKIYPLAIRWFLENKLVIENNRVILKDNLQIPDPLVFPYTNSQA